MVALRVGVALLVLIGCLSGALGAALQCPNEQAQKEFGKCDMQLIQGTKGEFNGGIYTLDCKDSKPKKVLKVSPKKTKQLDDLSSMYKVEVDVFKRLTTIAERMKSGDVKGVVPLLAVCHFGDDAEAVIMPQLEPVPDDGWTLDCFQSLYDGVKSLEKIGLMNNDIKNDNVMREVDSKKCLMVDPDSICAFPDSSKPEAFEVRGYPNGPKFKIVRYNLIAAQYPPCIISSYPHPNRARISGDYERLVKMINIRYNNACDGMTDVGQCLTKLKGAHKEPVKSIPAADRDPDATDYKPMPAPPDADQNDSGETNYKAISGNPPKQSTLSPGQNNNNNKPSNPKPQQHTWVRGQISKNL